MSTQQVPPQSYSKTNCTEAITNRFKQNKQRCHWPTWTTRQKQFYKTNFQSLHSSQSNLKKQLNTQSKSCSCLPSYLSTQRYQSKLVTKKQYKKQNSNPNPSSFTLNLTQTKKSLWFANSYVCSIQGNRASGNVTPFVMYTFKNTVVPKLLYGFQGRAKESIMLITCLSAKKGQKKNNNCSANCPHGSGKYKTRTPKKWQSRQMQTNQRYRSPRLLRTKTHLYKIIIILSGKLNTRICQNIQVRSHISFQARIELNNRPLRYQHSALTSELQA